jgi:tetratricopeptide (TPR) repeat protein
MGQEATFFEQVEPELEYMFRHALVQDATYESLLKADRRSLHHAVDHTLEILYADRLDEVTTTLALHFERAEEHEKAVGYLVRAGEAAAWVYAVDEAIELFGHALELIPDSYLESALTHLYSQYGRVLELAGRFDMAVEVYEHMRLEGIRLKSLQMELDALMARAILHSTPSPHHSFSLATQLSEQALSIAALLKNSEAQSHCYWMLMLANLFEGNWEAAITYGEHSLDIARSLANAETHGLCPRNVVESEFAYHSTPDGC